MMRNQRGIKKGEQGKGSRAARRHISAHRVTRFEGKASFCLTEKENIYLFYVFLHLLAYLLSPLINRWQANRSGKGDLCVSTVFFLHQRQ